MKNNLQEAQECLNRTQEHKTQTADNTIFMPPLKKEGHIALHMSVGMSVGRYVVCRSVGRYVGIP